MNRFTSILFGLSALALAVSGRGAGPEETATVLIEIRNFRFVPERVTVRPGTPVHWINRDDVAHDVTSGTAVTGRRARAMARTGFPDGRFSSGVFAPGSDYRVTLKKAGEYPYYCTIHPFMAGTIVVR